MSRKANTRGHKKNQKSISSAEIDPEDLCKSLRITGDVAQVFIDEFGTLPPLDGSNGPHPIIEALAKPTERALRRRPAGISSEDMDFLLMDFIGELWRQAAPMRNNDIVAPHTREVMQRAKRFFKCSKLQISTEALEDRIRTETYIRIIAANVQDFNGKVVLDIGAGNGAVSLYAASVGAEVHAIESSSAHASARKLSWMTPTLNFKLHDSLIESEIPKADVIVFQSIEPFLYSSLADFIDVRQRFLKPDGKMYPQSCLLCLALFEDELIHSDVLNCAFWEKHFTSSGPEIAQCAREDRLGHPIVDLVSQNQMVSTCPFGIDIKFDLIDMHEADSLTFPLEFTAKRNAKIHGLVGWFDLNFTGSVSKVTLSSAPWSPATHWRQTIFLLPEPLMVNEGQIVTGEFIIKDRFTVNFHLTIDGMNYTRRSFPICLDEPHYRIRHTTPTPGPAYVGMIQPAIITPAEISQFEDEMVPHTENEIQLQHASPDGNEPVGKILKLSGNEFIRIELPARVKTFSDPQCKLVYVTTFNKTHFYAPRNNLQHGLLQAVNESGNIVFKYWMNLVEYRANLMRTLMEIPNMEMKRDELEKKSVHQLSAFLTKMQQSKAQGS